MKKNKDLSEGVVEKYIKAREEVFAKDRLMDDLILYGSAMTKTVIKDGEIETRRCDPLTNEEKELIYSFDGRHLKIENLTSAEIKEKYGINVLMPTPAVVARHPETSEGDKKKLDAF